MDVESVVSFGQKYFSFHSYVIIGYFLICLSLFILNTITNNKVTSFLKIRRGSFFNPMNYLRLVTSSLCHSDFNHFKNNFIFILLLGPILEEKYGSFVLLEMLLITMVASSLFHLLFYDSSAIGSSDVVYMMVMLCAVACSFDKKIPITFVFLFLFFVLGEILLMFFHKKGDKTSHDGHVVGAILGFVFGYFIF